MSPFSWLFGSQATNQPAPAGGDQSHSLPKASPSTIAPALPPQSPSSEPSSLPRPLEAPSLEPPPQSTSSVLSQRSVKQLGLFLAGAGFLATSIRLSRRAAIRHHSGAQLRFYFPNYKSTRKGDHEERRDPLVAVEALNLATLNVLSFGIMAAGGLSWAFDISSLDDLRAKARRTLYGPGGRTDEDSEQELAEWVAKTLGTKDGAKSKEGQASRPNN